VIFKLEYGSSGQSASTPNLWLTVGTASDGAGTITGTFFAAITSANQIATRRAVNSSSSANPLSGTTVYVQGDTGSLAMFLWPGSTTSASNGMMLVLERTRAFDGTSTGDGFHLFTASADLASNGTCTQALVSFLANGAAVQSGTPSTNQPGSNVSGVSTVIGSTLYAIPMLTGVNLKIGAPSQYFLCVAQGDLIAGSTVAITHYGTSYTWRAAGYGSASSGGAGWGVLAQGQKSFVFRIT
jgi:hypothetical protein